MVADTVLAGTPYGVFYYPAAAEVYGASKVQRLAAVFESPPIDGGQYLLSWKNLTWDSTVPAWTNLYTYARSAPSEASLQSTPWSGPFFNGSTDIAGLSGRYMQIAFVLYTYVDGSLSYESNTYGPEEYEGALYEGEEPVEEEEHPIVEGEFQKTPAVSRMTVSSHVSSGAQLFFTKEFSLGFKPKHLLLTYNGTIPEGAMVQFAVAGADTTDPGDYQVVTPNRVEELNNISSLSKGVKVMLMATGSIEIPFVVDEFSLALSGDGQKVMS